MPSPPPTDAREHRLDAVQICFVVEDVEAAKRECVERFGWGPFQGFTAQVGQGHYRGWTGPKRTEVALGMAGRIQIELIHVHEGRDAIAAYQERYSRGAQHLGLVCADRDAAITRLVGLGATLDERNEYDGVRIAFVDVPCGPAMFELLEPVRADAAGGATRQRGWAPDATRLAVDRVTLVSRDLDPTLRFFGEALGWQGVVPSRMRLQTPSGVRPFERAIGRSGALEIELLAPLEPGDDPYARHLAERSHGLVHASAVSDPTRWPETESAAPVHEWLETGERFRFCPWAAGEHALQLRCPPA